MNPLYKIACFGALVLAVCITAATVLGTLLAQQWWIGELLSHPRPQYVLILLCCLPLLVARFHHFGWLVLIPLLLNLTAFIPLYFNKPLPLSTPSFTVLHYNLDATLPNHEPAFTYLRNHPVDILLLQELTPELERNLTTALPHYQIVYSHPMKNTHGSVFLLASNSDIRVISANVVHLPHYSPRPMITALLDISGREVALLSLHVTRSRNAGTSTFQQTELAAVAAWSRAQQTYSGRNVLIIGDFNTTPWSARFQQLKKEGLLLSSESGYGVQSTWPAYLPPVFGIPIDLCLYSQGITIVNRQIGSFLGSDHRPLLIEFQLNTKVY